MLSRKDSSLLCQETINILKLMFEGKNIKIKNRFTNVNITLKKDL